MAFLLRGVCSFITFTLSCALQDFLGKDKAARETFGQYYRRGLAPPPVDQATSSSQAGPASRQMAAAAAATSAPAPDTATWGYTARRADNSDEASGEGASNGDDGGYEAGGAEDEEDEEDEEDAEENNVGVAPGAPAAGVPLAGTTCLMRLCESAYNFGYVLHDVLPFLGGLFAAVWGLTVFATFIAGPSLPSHLLGSVATCAGSTTLAD